MLQPFADMQSITTVLGIIAIAAAVSSAPVEVERAQRAIYGADSRVDEADTTPEWRAVGRATVMLVSRNVIGSSGTLLLPALCLCSFVIRQLHT